jgi:hypothetical protein
MLLFDAGGRHTGVFQAEGNGWDKSADINVQVSPIPGDHAARVNHTSNCKYSPLECAILQEVVEASLQTPLTLQVVGSLITFLSTTYQ